MNYVLHRTCRPMPDLRYKEQKYNLLCNTEKKQACDIPLIQKKYHIGKKSFYIKNIDLWQTWETRWKTDPNQQ